MYCPQCGQQQASGIVRYCSKCGFLLNGVAAVVATGGVLPVRHAPPGSKRPSPRSKGVKQGALIMLSTILLVPLAAIIGVVLLDLHPAIVGVTAVTCFVGGLLRIFYALLMEDSVAPGSLETLSGNAQPAMSQLSQPVQSPRLPPAGINSAADWRPRANTAELYQPPSVTENTTRLLDKDKPQNS